MVSGILPVPIRIVSVEKLVLQQYGILIRGLMEEVFDPVITTNSESLRSYRGQKKKFEHVHQFEVK